MALGPFVGALQVTAGALTSLYKRDADQFLLSGGKFKKTPRPTVLDHSQRDNEGENDAVWRERQNVSSTLLFLPKLSPLSHVIICSVLRQEASISRMAIEIR